MRLELPSGHPVARVISSDELSTGKCHFILSMNTIDSHGNTANLFNYQVHRVTLLPGRVEIDFEDINERNDMLRAMMMWPELPNTKE